MIEFPSDPTIAARLYYGVMAYPEVGAGQSDGAGFAFAESLREYAVWSYRRGRGLADLRQAFQDEAIRPPEWRSFAHRMNRGLDRIRRRITVFELFQRRQLTAIGKTWGKNSTLAEFQQAMPGWGTILNQDVDGWRGRAALNLTGVGGEDKAAKAKDFRRRVIAPSLPVLHLAYGLSIAGGRARDQIGNWENRDPLTALFLNPNRWVSEAFELAIKFRTMSAIPGFNGELVPTDMIELRPEICTEMPPAASAAE